MEEVLKRDIVAQDIMDLYYQDFKEDDEQFFDIDFFKRQVNDAFLAIAREEYKEAYRLLRQEGRHLIDFVEFTGKWLKTEDVEIKADDETGLYKGSIKKEVATFPFDQSNIGVQQIETVKFNACNLVRTRRAKSWLHKHMPKTEVVFWWTEGSKEIYLTGNCCGSKLRVLYVPFPDADLEMEGGLASQIKDMVLNLMFRARDGVVIDQTNDGNANKLPQTETNKENLT